MDIPRITICRMTAGYDEKQNKISIIKKELTGTRYSVT